MITFWTFRENFTLVAWIFGIPLLGLAAAFVVPAWLAANYGVVDIQGPMWELFILIVAGDLAVGAVSLAVSRQKARATAVILTLAIYGGGGLFLVGPSLGLSVDLNDPITEWGKPKVMEGWDANNVLEHGYELNYEKSETHVAYNLSDLAEIDKVMERQYESNYERVDALEPYWTLLENIEVSVVDNQFQVSGFGDNVDTIFIIAEAYGTFSRTDRGKVHEFENRFFIADVLEISSSDRSRGYANLRFLEKNGGYGLSERKYKKLVQSSDPSWYHARILNSML